MSMRFLSTIAQGANHIWRFLMPPRCIVCKRPLGEGEKYICTPCMMHVPLTHIHGERGNGFERLFWMKLPIERASAFMSYTQEENSRKLLMAAKFFSHPDIGVYLGEIMADDLLDTDFFDGIDFIVPVPLHKKRFQERGYNQSEQLARGVANLTHLPINTTAVVRSRYAQTQSCQRFQDRAANVKDAFSLAHPEEIQGKHILIIDDVITSGSTITACATAAAAAEGVRISILAFALAGSHHSSATYYEPTETLPAFPMGK